MGEEADLRAEIGGVNETPRLLCFDVIELSMAGPTDIVLGGDRAGRTFNVDGRIVEQRNCDEPWGV